MTEYVKKRALRKLTKSEKRQAQSIREEIEFLERIPKLHPHLLEYWGKEYWAVKLAIAKKELDNIYDTEKRSKNGL